MRRWLIILGRGGDYPDPAIEVTEGMARPGFRGGVHPPHGKEATAHLPVRDARPPGKVVVSLHQHTGAMCEPTVAVGDTVRLGQKIGDSKAALTAPVHASVSGKVTSVGPHLQFHGRETPSVVIESDGLDTPIDGMSGAKPLAEMSPDEIIALIREAGIVGLGGAAFPTYFKLRPPKGKTVDTLILNGCECEPYLTADHRTMVERPGDVLFGMKALMRAVGVARGIIAVEANKPDAAEALERAAGVERGRGLDVSVATLPVKYPQGAEKQLVYALLRREVPSGGLPLDVGVVVNNVGTAVATNDALTTGMPLVKRVVTVTGSCVQRPGNLMVRVGALVSDILDECGLSEPPGKVIMGGPMMGVASGSLDVPVVKGTSGILVLTRAEAAEARSYPCVRCANCVDACPMRLLPLFICQFMEKGLLEQAEQYSPMDCIECGCCSYVCPSRRPLVQAIRLAKAEITARRRAAASA